MTTVLVEELRGLRWGVLEAIRNRLGFTKDQAKKIFNSFRGQDADQGPEPPKGDPGKKAGGRSNRPAPENPVGPTAPGGQDFGRIVHYMQETNKRLDHMERDLEYVKQQVDRILAKL